MFSYTDILNDEQVLNIYKAVDIEINYVVSHGLTHVLHVVESTKLISKAVGLTEAETRLALIAAALHDIGRSVNNDNHQKESFKLTKKYLKGKLTATEIKVVANAVLNHGGDYDKVKNFDRISVVVRMADKIDLTKSRLIESLMYQANERHEVLYKNTNVMWFSNNDNFLTLNIEVVEPRGEEFYRDFVFKKHYEPLFLYAVKMFGFKGFKFLEKVTN